MSPSFLRGLRCAARPESFSASWTLPLGRWSHLPAPCDLGRWHCGRCSARTSLCQRSPQGWCPPAVLGRRAPWDFLSFSPVFASVPFRAELFLGLRDDSSLAFARASARRLDLPACWDTQTPASDPGRAHSSTGIAPARALLCVRLTCRIPRGARISSPHDPFWVRPSRFPGYPVPTEVSGTFSLPAPATLPRAASLLGAPEVSGAFSSCSFRHPLPGVTLHTACAYSTVRSAAANRFHAPGRHGGQARQGRRNTPPKSARHRAFARADTDRLGGTTGRGGFDGGRSREGESREK